MKQDLTGLNIGVPTMGWQMNAGLVRFLMAANRRGAHLLTVDNYKPNEYARNLIVGLFLDRCVVDSERLWFIDSDMVPPDNAFDLLDVDADLVSARCLYAGADGGTIKFDLNGYRREPHSFVSIPEATGTQDVDACGTASLLVKRAVLESSKNWHKGEFWSPIEAVWHDCSFRHEGTIFAPPVFKAIYAPNGQRLVSQDINFSWRMKQLLYSVKYCHDVKFGHLKTVNLDLMRVASPVFEKEDSAAEELIRG